MAAHGEDELCDQPPDFRRGEEVLRRQVHAARLRGLLLSHLAPPLIQTPRNFGSGIPWNLVFIAKILPEISAPGRLL